MDSFFRRGISLQRQGDSVAVDADPERAESLEALRPLGGFEGNEINAGFRKEFFVNASGVPAQFGGMAGIELRAGFRAGIRAGGDEKGSADGERTKEDHERNRHTMGAAGGLFLTNGIAQDANAFDLDFHHLAGLEPAFWLARHADAMRRAGDNDRPWQQRGAGA
jgi:hypothetical protein